MGFSYERSTEDGNITKIEVIENTVKIDVVGTYLTTYKVTDSFNQSVTKTIKVKKITIFVKIVHEKLTV